MTHLYVVQTFRSAVGRPDQPPLKLRRSAEALAKAEGLRYTQALQVIVAPAGRTRWRGSMGFDDREVRVRGTSASEPNRSRTDVLRAAAIRARFSTEMFRRPRSTLDT